MTLRTREVVDLGPLFEGWAKPVVVGSGFDGEIYAAARRGNEQLWVTRHGCQFPKSRLRTPTDYRVVCWQDGLVLETELRDESIAVHHVQPYPGGVLLVGARCAWHTSGAEHNAVAVDWDGRVLARFTLGDGINDVRVARDGTIWAAYFDEGVLGSGSQGPGSQPIGMPGLVAFSPTGEVSFRYDPGAARTDDIVDVYALNVAAHGDVWLLFHSEFALVKIRRGSYRAWRGFGECFALAVRRNRVLLCGRYQNRQVVRTVVLDEDGTGRVENEQMLEELEGAAAWGVGEALYLVRDQQVRVLDDW